MKHILPIIGLAALAQFSVSAVPVTIDFESVPGADPLGFVEVPDGYAGLNWDNFYAARGADAAGFYGGSGYEHGVTSGEWIVLNGFGFDAASSDTSFDFLTAQLTSAFIDNNDVTLTGWLDGAQIYGPIAFTVNTSGPTLAAINFLGVDEVRFSSSSSTLYQFVMDDMVVDFATTPIPTPDGGATVLLLGSALLAIGAGRNIFRA